MLSGRLGPYTLNRQIALGGMAEIYLAVVTGSDPVQQVAIKVIHQRNARDPDFVRMLLDEAKLAVLLKHPNIVSTYDLGREADQYYLVMEYVEGADLFKIQQRAAEQRLSFPIAQAAYVAREVARGLDYAHRMKDERGRPLRVVHRDISPQNVLLSFSGEVKVTDFGIAKAQNRSEETQAGIIKGKYYYMSPEQAAGQRLDGRTDIFATGILLYEMLIGEMLYYDEDIERVLAMVRRAEIAPPSRRRRDIPEQLERILMKALRRRPDDRYQGANELAQALDVFLREFAPTFIADDLGLFVERVSGTSRQQRRGADEPTAAMNRPMELKQSGDTPSPTRGISEDQVAGLGVHDDNSLIYGAGSALAPMLFSEAIGFSGETASLDHNVRQSAALGWGEAIQPKLEVEPSLLEESELGVEPAEPTDPRARFTQQPKTRADAGSARGGQSGPYGRAVDRTGALQRSRPPVRNTHEVALIAREIVGEPGSGRVSGAQSAVEFQQMPSAAPVEPIELSGSDSQAYRAVGLAAPGASGPTSGSGYGPKLELQQSDNYATDSTAIPPDGADESLDHISVESTHEDLVPPPLPPGFKIPRSQRSQPPSGQSLPSVLVASGTFQPPSSGSGIPTGPSVTEIDPVLSQPPKNGLFLPILSHFAAALAGAAISAVVMLQTRVPHRRVERPVEVADLAAPSRDAGVADLAKVDAAAPETKPEPTPKGPNVAASNVGEIDLTSVPEGAEVYLDKRLLGVTPLVVHDLPLDTDPKFELRLEGYKKTRKRIKWRGKTSVTAEVTLKPLAGGAADAPPAASGAAPTPAPESDSDSN